jgi:acetyl-CoA carboxylase alpha subunit
MPPETLEFEEPIAAVLREIEALNQLPRTDALDRQIETLQRKVQSVRAELYASLTRGSACVAPPGQTVPGGFRHAAVHRLRRDHGDRRFADDHAIMTGLAGRGSRSCSSAT